MLCRRFLDLSIRNVTSTRKYKEGQVCQHCGYLFTLSFSKPPFLFWTISPHGSCLTIVRTSEKLEKKFYLQSMIKALRQDKITNLVLALNLQFVYSIVNDFDRFQPGTGQWNVNTKNYEADELRVHFDAFLMPFLGGSQTRDLRVRMFNGECELTDRKSVV